jgi:hypothetical protein
MNSNTPATAACAMVSIALTSSQEQVLYDAYVCTIGRGLGLTASGLGLTLDQIAQLDLDGYVADVTAEGGTISDAEQANLLAYAKALYAEAGKQVDFVTFRSGQNVGTGSIALSWLGQRLTLVNGPTWGVDGLSFSASAYVDLRGTVPASPVTFLAVTQDNCLRDPNTFDAPAILGQFNTGGGRTIQAAGSQVRFVSNTDSGGGFRYAATGLASDTTRAFFGFSVTGGGDTNAEFVATVNGAALTTGSAGSPIAWDSLPANNRYFMHGGVSPTTRFGAFALCAGIALTATQQSAVRAAYKTTIGQGLGLP